MAIDVGRWYYAICESSHYGSQIPEYCFDGNDNTFWEGTGEDSWVAFFLGSGKFAVVNKIRIWPRNYGGMECKDFVLYGSNNSTNGIDGNWTLLLSGQHTNNDVKEEFVVPSPESFSWYKLLIDTSWRTPYVGGLLTFEAYADEFELNMPLGEFLIPKMTSNSDPMPYIASGSNNYGGQAPWNAFDRSPSTWFWMDTNPNWLAIDLVSEKKISWYLINSPYSNNNYAKSWVLEGSNDNTSWETIDTQTGFSRTGVDTYFKVSPASAYRYYRLNNLVGYNNYALVGEFNLFEDLSIPAKKQRRFVQLV